MSWIIISQLTHKDIEVRLTHHRTFLSGRNGSLPSHLPYIYQGRVVTFNSHSPGGALWCSGTTGSPPTGGGYEEVPGSTPGVGGKNPPPSEVLSPPSEATEEKTTEVFRNHRPSTGEARG